MADCSDLWPIASRRRTGPVVSYALASVVVLTGAALASGDGAVVWHGVAALLAAVALLLAGRRATQAGTNPWYCLAVGVALWSTAAGLGHYLVLTDQPVPLVVGIVRTAGYVAIGIGFLVFANVRHDVSSRVAFIDAFVVGTAAALAYWVLVVGPLGGGDIDPVERLRVIATPFRVGILITVIGWVVLAPGRRTPALRILTVALAGLLLADGLFDVARVQHADWTRPAELLGSAAVLLMGLAGVVTGREIREVTEEVHDDHVARSLLMALALLSVPIMTAIGDLTSTDGTIVVVICSTLLAVGVIARFVNLVHRNRRAAEATAASERRFRMLADSVPVGIYEIGRGGRVLYANREAQRLLGANSAGSSIDTLTPSLDADSRSRFEDALRQLGEAQPASVEMCIDEDGRWFTWQSVPVLAVDPATPIAFASTVDVTALKQAEAALARQATHDPLTGLPNRRELVEALMNALEQLGRGHRTGTVALMFVDLDGFKLVNDVLGHDRGDQLLVTAATRLRNSVRSHDIVARFGGDEFVVLMRNVADRGELHDVARRILDSLNSTIDLSGTPAHVGASIGIAIAGGPEDDPDALIRAADVAMYRAKERGRGRYEFARPGPVRPVDPTEAQEERVVGDDPAPTRLQG